MPGDMQKRGNSSWRLHAFVGRDSSGRKRYASKTFHGTKTEAGLALAAFVTEVAKDRSTSSAVEPTTVTQTLETRSPGRTGAALLDHCDSGLNYLPSVPGRWTHHPPPTYVV